MKLKTLEILRCPVCKEKLKLNKPVYEKQEIKEGELICKRGCVYQIRNFIPRFVKSDKYVSSFSFEWKKHKLTQYDSHNNNKASEENFKNHFGLDLESLKGKLVIDVGCGSGRYAEIASKYSDFVIGVDLSYSVDFARVKNCKNVDLVQADIFNLPFDKGTFDVIYSFGVLHHTPNCEKAFKSISPLLKKGGIISIFVYASYNKAVVYSSNFWRIFTTRLPKRIVYYFSFLAIPIYYIYRIPVLGHFLKMLFPISMEEDPKVRALDTFDWYTPKYQSKHTHSEVAKWFKEEKINLLAIPKGEISLVGMKR